MDSSNITQTIIDTINSIFSTLFSSIDNSIYSILDKLVFVDSDVVSNGFMSSFLNGSSNRSLIIIANSLLFAFAIYYCIKLLYSHFVSTDIERPYQFIFKILVVGIFVNCSYFLVDFFIDINFNLSSAINRIGEFAFNKSINFSSLISNLNSIVTIEGSTFNIFSLDGIVKGFISFGLLSLIFSYTLRYVMIKVFVLITPFAISSLVIKSTSWFFRTWIKSIFSLLIIQSFVSLILLIIFSIDYSDDIFSKFMYIGGIYALSKANSYVRELIGGISTDLQLGISSLRGIINK